MNLKSWKLLIGAGVVSVAQVARATIVVAPEPSGMSTFAMLYGSAGVPTTPAQWSTGESGLSLYTLTSDDPVAWDASLFDAPDWRLGVTAMNVLGPLPSKYTDFTLNVSVNGKKMGSMTVPASDSQWNTAWFDLGQRSGATEVTLTWKNDAHGSQSTDANISFGALQFASHLAPTPGTGALIACGGCMVAARARRKP